MNLHEVAKKDKNWRRYALKLTQNKNLADEVVQEMYLKIMDIRKELNDFYIVLTIRSIFFDMQRKKKVVCYVEDGFLQKLHEEKQPNDRFEVNDQQKKILDEYKKLPFHQQELIIENYSKSLRSIEKEFNINYGYVHNEIKKARKKLLKWQK